MGIKKNTVIAIVLFLIGISLVGFSFFRFLKDKGKQPIADANTDANGVEKISLRLKWIHQGQFAGFYVAQTLGFYKNEKLDVKIGPGGQDMGAIRCVASGEDNIGIWGAEQILLARSNGISVVAIGVIYQETAACYMVRAGSGINTFKDIEGKTVGTQIGTDHETIYQTLLKLNNVDRSKVKEMNVSYNLALFLNGQVDVWPSYLINEPYIAKQQGIEVKIITPKDSGLHFYGDTLFCTQDFADTKKDTLKRFLRATMKGWDYALNHPEEAAEICCRYDKMLDKKHQLFMINASKDFIKPQGGNFLKMTDEGWLTIHKVLKEQGLLKQDVPVSEVYTNKFIPQQF